jgi:hypothetical protein
MLSVEDLACHEIKAGCLKKEQWQFRETSNNRWSVLHREESVGATTQAAKRRRWAGNLGECSWLFFVSASQRDGRADFVQTMLEMAWLVVLALSLIIETLIENEISRRNPVMNSERREVMLTERVQMGFLIGFFSLWKSKLEEQRKGRGSLKWEKVQEPFENICIPKVLEDWRSP